MRVDVLVTEDGRPVRGLGRGDFEVLDNGVPQEVDLASFEQIPLNVVLAIDVSDSVAGERLDHLRRAGHAMLAGLQKEDQAALVTFSHVVAEGSGLTRDHARVRTALDRAQAVGQTALIDRSFVAMMLGESDVGRSLVIVFSDGLDTSSWLSADVVLETARRSDVVVYAVSAYAYGSASFLWALTAFTGGTHFEVESTKNLDQTFVRVLEEFRQRYLVSYTPRGVSRDGWHRLEVRVRGRSASVKARPGYLAGPSLIR